MVLGETITLVKGNMAGATDVVSLPFTMPHTNIHFLEGNFFYMKYLSNGIFSIGCNVWFLILPSSLVGGSCDAACRVAPSVEEGLWLSSSE